MENMYKYLKKLYENIKESSEIKPGNEEIDKITLEVTNLITPYAGYRNSYNAILEWQHQSKTEGLINLQIKELIEAIYRKSLLITKSEILRIIFCLNNYSFLLNKTKDWEDTFIEIENNTTLQIKIEENTKEYETASWKNFMDQIEEYKELEDKLVEFNKGFLRIHKEQSKYKLMNSELLNKIQQRNSIIILEKYRELYNLISNNTNNVNIKTPSIIEEKLNEFLKNEANE